MATNSFTALRKSHGVSNWRRVGHSFTNYFSSIDRSSFSLGNAPKVLEQGANFAGTTGMVGSAIALGSATAATAVAGAGFLAAIAGPQVAVTAGVIGLVLMIKGTYSNREAAHKAIADYVWNLVDTEPPSKGFNTVEDLNDACTAAMTLLDDGKNQIKLLGSKISTAGNKLTVFHTDLKKKCRNFKTELDNYNRAGQSSAARKTAFDSANRILREIHEEFAEACERDGAIFEYVRRCAHTGNYIQAAQICALAMKENLKPGSVVSSAVPQPQTDYFSGFTLATESRGLFTELEKEYKKVNDLVAAFNSAPP